MSIRDLCHGRTLIALCGAPASGKSTLAEQCADLATVVSVDALRSRGAGGGLDPFGPKATRRAFNKAYGLVDRALATNRPVVLDSTAVTLEARASILRLADKNHAAACHLIICDVPLEILRERNDDRQSPCPDELLVAMHGDLTTGLAALDDEGFDSVTRLR
jgi:predicted kinase